MHSVPTRSLQAGLLFLALHSVAQPASAAEAGDSPAGLTSALSVTELSRRVVEHNLAVQEKLLSYAVSHRRFRGEQGVFEPSLFGSATREYNERQNNTKQIASGNGIFVLQEDNNIYEAGIEAVTLTGGKIRAGYDLSDLHNNIPPTQFTGALPGRQYQSFAGLSITQPLLKGFGTKATLAKIRLAAQSSTIAYQEYRKELLTTVGTAEATYWTLYLAQQQVGYFEESVRVAEKILADNRLLFQAGKGSDLEVLQAQAGVGLRRAKLEEAQQKVAEATDRLISLYGEAVSPANRVLFLADSPALEPISSVPTELLDRAKQLNPDYLVQQEKLQQELVRLGYARNQRLPEVNFKGAYGLNGLDDSIDGSFDTVNKVKYSSWSIGMEVRFPIGGDIRGRHELAAARLQVTAAETALRALETELTNGIDAALQRVMGARNSATSFQAVVKYNQALLDAALVSLAAGKIESRKVLQIESDLFDAKNSVLEALVNYKVALVKLGFLTGSILDDRQLEITQDQLRDATKKLARTRKWDDAQYQEALREVHKLYPAGES